MSPDHAACRTARRSPRTLPTLFAVMLLAALGLGGFVGAPQAAGGAVAVEDIEIVGAPKLYVQPRGGGAGYNSAWIVFRTRPHLHISRQVVVEIRGLKGRSYGGSGAPNCVRSTVIQANRLVKRGHRYRVRFYARPGSHGTATALRKTITLTARHFPSPPGSASVPRC